MKQHNMHKLSVDTKSLKFLSQQGLSGALHNIGKVVLCKQSFNRGRLQGQNWCEQSATRPPFVMWKVLHLLVSLHIPHVHTLTQCPYYLIKWYSL
jgi:hypothetical protein